MRHLEVREAAPCGGADLYFRNDHAGALHVLKAIYASFGETCVQAHCALFSPNIYFFGFAKAFFLSAVALGVFELRFGVGEFSCSMQTLSCGMWDLVP